MKFPIKSFIRQEANQFFGLFGYELVHSMRADRPIEEYIPFRSTINGAKKEALSVGDYIDRHFAGAGTTQKTMDLLIETGALDKSMKRICEIGPGSGRYLEKVIKFCQPDYYEIYETAKEWREYLLKTYPVVAQPCPGNHLASTPSESMDLVHGHRVVTSIPIMVSYSYFLEMARVLKPGGKAIFDTFSEDCLDEPTARKWIDKGALHPQFFSKPFVVNLFRRHGMELENCFYVELEPGRTEYLIFKKGTLLH